MFLPRRSRTAINSKSRNRFQSTQLAVETLERRVVMTAGMLDTTFGDDGMVSTYVSSKIVTSIGPRLDGDKILVGGSVPGGTVTTGTGKNAVTTTDPSDFTIARFNSDGTSDTTFGNQGRATLKIGSRADEASDLVVTADGKYIMVGSSVQDHVVTVGRKSTTYTNTDVAVVRFNANGTLDTTFGSGGKVLLQFGSAAEGDRGSEIVLQPDGKIVVAGNHSMTSTIGGTQFALARLNANGSLDGSFGAGGIVKTRVGSGGDQIGDLAVQTLGTETFLVVAGQSNMGTATNWDTSLIRYTQNGSVASSSTLNLGGVHDNLTHLVVTPEGAIAAASYVGPPENDDLAVLKFSPQGTLDTTFGSAGLAVVAMPYDQIPTGLALQADGKFVVAARSNVDDSTNAAQHLVARLTSQGQLDPTFGNSTTAGVTLWAYSGSSSQAPGSIAIQSDGKILALARVQPANSAALTDWVLTRLTADDPIAPAPEETSSNSADLAILFFTAEDGDLEEGSTAL